MKRTAESPAVHSSYPRIRRRNVETGDEEQVKNEENKTHPTTSNFHSARAVLISGEFKKRTTKQCSHGPLVSSTCTLFQHRMSLKGRSYRVVKFLAEEQAALEAHSRKPDAKASAEENAP